MAILTVLFLVRDIQIPFIVDAFKSARLSYLAPAFLLLGPNLLVQLLKWRYLLRLANPNVSVATAYKSFIIGYPLGFLTPGRVGEVGRAFFVRDISRKTTAKLFVVDKFATLIVIGFSGVLGLLFLNNSSVSVYIVLAHSAILFLCLILFLPAIREKIGRFLGNVSFKPRDIAILFILSALFYLTFLSQLVILILAFESVDVGSASAGAAATFLVKTLLPVAAADLGIREGAAVYFCGQIGVGAAAAFNAAFLLFVINVVTPTLIGLPMLLKPIPEAR
ncbi:flippase-like domain-containing protein [candidate division KSB1 bacterium]|nr:flippase-like domain-containing protein [candidate division KSB1 bacterium]NIR73265.1 flippase-like domain-containing protein [candidate division KSB1 bacterium]NIS26971.1 flippase-like domain-containing protein [candidate division KSB1 bacterium]NIT73810.1 flippase-like domain-containing protein [candidate division KSB1 bacterium]NIU27715.1 flippase-like domain-containing protein [candidate division KSB1 bacterium]